MLQVKDKFFFEALDKARLPKVMKLSEYLSIINTPESWVNESNKRFNRGKYAV